MKKFVPEITSEEHSRNLYLLSRAKTQDQNLSDIEQELRELIGQYHNLLLDLSQTVEAYRSRALTLREKTGST